MTFVDNLTAAQVKQIRNLGQDVTYVDGQTEISLKAFLGRSRAVAETAEGDVRIDWSDQDFLVVADDLAVDGVQVVPIRGARIDVVLDGVTYGYELQPLGEEHHWRWSGPGRCVRRIHGKLIEQEAV